MDGMENSSGLGGGMKWEGSLISGSSSGALGSPHSDDHSGYARKRHVAEVVLKSLKVLMSCEGQKEKHKGTIDMLMRRAFSELSANIYENQLTSDTLCTICQDKITEQSVLFGPPTCRDLFHQDCIFKWFFKCEETTCPNCKKSYLP